MPSRPISRRLDTVLRDAFDLPRRDQLTLFDELRVYLGDEEIGQADERDERAQAQKLVIECLEKSAAFHGLDLAAEAITTRHYTEAKKVLDLPLSQKQIIGICGRWLAALAIVRGHWVPETVRQKAQRSKLHSRHRTDAEYFADVRAFLATKPRSATSKLYDAWARGERQKGVIRRNHQSISQQLGRTWSEVIAAASTGKFPAIGLDTLPEFIPPTTAAAILGLTQPSLLRDDRYPNPVLHSGRFDLYMLEDIVAFSEGRPVPDRAPYSYQERYMLPPELALRLGLDRGSIYTQLAKEKYHLVPKPNVRVPGYALLWLRSDVASFLIARNRRKAASRAKKRRVRPDKGGAL